MFDRTAGENVPLRYFIDKKFIQFKPLGDDTCSIQLNVVYQDDGPLDQEVFTYESFRHSFIIDPSKVEGAVSYQLKIVATVNGDDKQRFERAFEVSFENFSEGVSKNRTDNFQTNDIIVEDIT